MVGPPLVALLGKFELGACANERPTLKRNVAVEKTDRFLFLLMRAGCCRNIIFYMSEDAERRIKNPVNKWAITHPLTFFPLALKAPRLFPDGSAPQIEATSI
jgi:hypothetical protein